MVPQRLVGTTPGPCTPKLKRKMKSSKLDWRSSDYIPSDNQSKSKMNSGATVINSKASVGRNRYSYSPTPEVILDRIPCPITGCGNFGGRGYKRSYIVKHLNSHTAVIKASAGEREKL